MSQEGYDQHGRRWIRDDDTPPIVGLILLGLLLMILPLVLLYYWIKLCIRFPVLWIVTVIGLGIGGLYAATHAPLAATIAATTSDTTAASSGQSDSSGGTQPQAQNIVTPVDTVISADASGARPVAPTPPALPVSNVNSPSSNADAGNAAVGESTYYVNALDHDFTGVFVRAAPGLSTSILKELGNGAQLQVLDRPYVNNDGISWAAVRSGDATGYARADLLSRDAPRPLRTLYVSAVGLGYTGVNMRAQPRLDGEMRMEIPQGATVQAADDQVSGPGGLTWVRIVYKDHTGYARDTFLASEPPPSNVTLQVDGAGQGYTGANLRTQPHLDAPLMTLIPNGASVDATRVVVGDDDRNWTQVTYNGMTGYAHSSILHL